MKGRHGELSGSCGVVGEKVGETKLDQIMESLG